MCFQVIPVRISVRDFRIYTLNYAPVQERKLLKQNLDEERTF